MADQVESGAEGVNGAVVDLAPAGSKLTRDQILAQQRAAFLSGTDEGMVGDKPAPASPKKPVAKPVVDDDDDDAELDGAGDDQDVDLDDEPKLEAPKKPEPKVEAADDDSDLDEDADLEQPDAETAKRMEKVRRTEQRARERQQQVETEWTKKRDAEVAKFEADWKPRVEKAERFEALSKNAKYRMVDIARELGLSDEDLELAAHDLYAHSKKGSEDPKRREVIARTKRERELSDEVAQLKKRTEEREATEKQREEQTSKRAAVEGYLDDVTKAASDKVPLAKKYLAANPAKARVKLEALANKLTAETGSIPDPKAVMIALEKDRRRALRELGIDPKTLTPAQAAAAAKVEGKKAAAPIAAGAKKPAEGAGGRKLTYQEQLEADRKAFIAGGDDN